MYMKTALLHCCFAIHKLAYALCTRHFDALIRESQETIVGAIFQSGVGSRLLSQALLEKSIFGTPLYMHLQHMLPPLSLLRPL